MMKAKYVYENIDFERGRDPKEALDIGNPEKRLINKLDSIAKKMGFHQELLEPEEIGNYLYSYNAQPIYQWVREKGSKYKINKDDNYQGISKRRVSGLRYHFSKDFPQKLVLLRDEDSRDPEAYFIYWRAGRHEGETGVFTFEKIEGWINLFGPATPLDESLEFERGIDPKDALRVGNKWKWDMTREELAEKIMADVNDDDHFRDAIIRADMEAENAGYKDVDEYWEAVYGDGIVADSYYQRSEVEQCLEEVEEILDEKLKKYPWKIGKEAVVKGLFYDGAFRGVAYGSALNVIEDGLDPKYIVGK